MAEKSESREIAIIGMACIFPKAPDLSTFWHNILNKVSGISEATAEHWDTTLYYDPRPGNVYRSYCRHGGFLQTSELQFDPLEYGVQPRAVPGGEPDQFLSLRAAQEALADAGHPEKTEARTRSAVIMGRGNYTTAGIMSMVQHGWVLEQTLRIVRSLRPDLGPEEIETLRGTLKASLPPYSADVFPSLIPNVLTGRIANRFDLMGPNYTIDAACASSLIALEAAVRELRSGRCDLALVGGVHTANTLLARLVFCGLNAMSPTGKVRSFDKAADGTVIGEGVGVVVLKRREDAVRDGDRIYAVVKGVGVSSDGKGAAVLAPRKEGALLALQRAYGDAGIEPETVSLIEGHGTGTLVGDTTELEAMQQVFGHRRGPFAPCALGSVKSMIGHLLPASGVAGLIKAVLALYHKVLPPTLECEEPNPALDRERGFFYLNTEVRPWIHGTEAHPRRAAVSAFGFGGINAHVVLEEDTSNEEDRKEHLLQWNSELFLIEAPDRKQLLEAVDRLSHYVARCPQVALRDIAYTLYRAARFRHPCLAIVAQSRDDLLGKLAIASRRLGEPHRGHIKDRKGIYYFQEILDPRLRPVFLFPGEGSQYAGMLSDLCMLFPEVRRCFDEADRSFLKRKKPYLLSDVVFPRPLSRREERKEAERLLWDIDAAILAVLTANQALYGFLSSLGIMPAALLGHSSGEYSALVASGMLDAVSEDLVLETNMVTEAMEHEGGVPEAGMVSVGADRARVEALIKGIQGDLYIAMDNCPHQVILVGDRVPIEQALDALEAAHIMCEPLPFKRGYHTPLFRPVSARLEEIFRKYPLSPPGVPLWSCTTMAPYPDDLDEVKHLLAEHWVRPVAFRETIERLYEEEGFRIFVEVGPRGNLCAFVEDILRGKPHLAIPANLPRRPGLEQLLHLLGMLAAQGFRLRLERLFEKRHPRELALDPALDTGAPADRGRQRMTLSLSLPEMRMSSVPPVLKTQGAVAAHARSAGEPEPSAAIAGPTLGAPRADPRSDPRFKAPSLKGGDSGEASAAAGSGQILVRYFETMERFLAVQQEVVEAYLKGDAGLRPLSARGGTCVTGATRASGSDDPSVPPQEADRPAPADGGGAPPGSTMAVPVEQSQGKMPSVPDGTIGPILLKLVSDRTGYPVEMLEPELDMEAELGIDSIKRIEILAALQAQFLPECRLDLEKASRKKTLRGLIELLDASLSGCRDGAEGAAGPTVSALAPPEGLPFIGEILYQDEHSVRCLRKFSLSQDLYLEDHILAGPVSIYDSRRRGLAVVPLTMSFEMMAEVASLLAPGLVVTGLRTIRAHRWIPVSENGLLVEIEARKMPQPSPARGVDIEVTVQESTEGRSAEEIARHPLIIKGRLHFDETYQEPPAAGPFALEGTRPSRWDPKRLYLDGMFHGPRFQAVRSVDQWGEDGTEATLEVLPFDRLFSSHPAPKLLMDPIVLDAVGQLVAFWGVETYGRGFTAFPYYCESVSLYGPPLKTGTRVHSRARIHLFGVNQVRADFDVLGPDRRVWMSMQGWEDRRFDLPEIFYRFWKHPLEHSLGRPLGLGIPEAGPPYPLAACTLDNPLPPDDTFWKDVWAHIVLGQGERAVYRSLKGRENRRVEWLLGRTVAKDAFRDLVQKQYGLKLGPADIEITRDESGCPRIGGPWRDDVRLENVKPVLSIAHASGSAIALVALPTCGHYRIGIDLENLEERRSGGWASLAFSETEKALLAKMSASALEEWELRFWCAKESLGKALGTGLASGPRAVEIVGCDVSSGTVLARPRPDRPQSHRSGDWSAAIPVSTRREGNWIVAWTFFEDHVQEQCHDDQRTGI